MKYFLQGVTRGNLPGNQRPRCERGFVFLLVELFMGKYMGFKPIFCERIISRACVGTVNRYLKFRLE